MEPPNGSSLFDLKALIASKISSSFSPILPESVHLSLNRAVEIIASSPEDSLTALGLISGDLLFYSLESGFFSSPSNPASTVFAFTDPSSESLPKAPVDDMDIKLEAEKVKINGDTELNLGASPTGFGASSQKRAKPSIHGEANSVKTVWKKAKTVSFGGASVCRPSISPPESSSQGEASPSVDKGSLCKGKNTAGGTPPSSRTPDILSNGLPARSKELPPSPPFGSRTSSVAHQNNGSLQSSKGMDANSPTPGILSHDLPSVSEERSKEAPFPPSGRWPYNHIAAISAPISGPTALADLQSRLAAYVVDMEARMRVVELSNLSSRVTAMEARVALAEGYEPRLRAAEERCSEITDMKVQVREIRRQVDHLIVDFTRASSEQALVLELVRQGKQHLAQAEALFQTATTLACRDRKSVV